MIDFGLQSIKTLMRDALLGFLNLKSCRFCKGNTVPISKLKKACQTNVFQLFKQIII